jgi:hypothetical protein
MKTVDVRTDHGVEAIALYLRTAHLDASLQGKLNDIVRLHKEIHDDQAKVNTRRQRPCCREVGGPRGLLCVARVDSPPPGLGDHWTAACTRLCHAILEVHVHVALAPGARIVRP